MLVAIGIDVIFFTGYYAADDKDYTWAAHKIAHGENFLIPRSTNYELGASRLAFTLPLGFVYWLSDGSVSWMSAFQILYHLGCIIIAFALGRVAHDERTGRIAAAIAATCPLLYNFAGVMFPDVAVGMWTGLALLTLLLALRRAKVSAAPAKTARWFYLAGFVVGLAYSVKASAVIITAPMAIAVIATFPSIRRPVWILHGFWLAAGLATILLVELFVLSALTGEWTSQFTLAQGATEWDFPRWADRYGWSPITRLMNAVDSLRAHLPITFIGFAGAAIIYPWLRTRSAALIAYLWCTFGYLTWGSASLSRYLPQPLFPRYYTPILLPAAVALAAVLVCAWDRYREWQKRPARIGPRHVAVCLAALAAYVIVHELSWNLPGAGNLDNSVWARSFVRAYEKAGREYPEYPIVLSEEIAFRLLPILLPDISPHTYWHTDDVPWGDDGRHTPAPPFIFLDWTRPSSRAGVRRVPDLDRSKVHVRALAIVYPAGISGIPRIRAAMHAIAGLEPDRGTDSIDPKYATMVYLVTERRAPRPAARALAPVVPVGDAEVGVYIDQSGAALRWTSAGRFAVQYFDDQREDRSPGSPMAEVPAASEITVSQEVHTFRGPISGRVQVFAYDEAGWPLGSGSTQVALGHGTARWTVTVAAKSIRFFRVRWELETSGPGGLRLGPLDVKSNAAAPTAQPATRATVQSPAH